MKRWQMLAVLAVAALTVATAGAAPFVVLKNNNRFEGVSIRAKPDGTIVLTMKDGRQFEFSRDQVAQAFADRPAAYDEAVRQIQAKKYDNAIPVLKKLIDDYRNLGWDERAMYALARAYQGKEDYKAAVGAYENLFKANPAAEKDGDVLWGYLDALLAAGRKDKLVPKLDELIKSGAREDAARAQVMRGDLRAKEGQLEAAVLDYLRTVFFFKKQAAIQPEAYLKVAQTLERMRDNRSKDWYKRLAEEYPESPQAAVARKNR